MSKHAHAIIIIKNEKGEYLQYFDDRWNSFLFPNCKLISNNHLDILKDSLKSKFHLHFDNLEIEYVTDKVHSKFSESARIEKEYHHYFYKVNAKLQQNLNSKKFVVENTPYIWLSLSELETDKRIQQVNHDIVEYIKEIESVNNTKSI